MNEGGGELVLGPRLLGEVVLVERRRVPTLRAAAAIGGRRPRTEEVAWAMASGAMAETFDQVGTLIPLRALRWIRRDRSLVEKQRLPDRKRGPDVERKAKIVSACGPPHRLDGRHQVGIDRIDIRILDLGEMVIWECGIEMIAHPVDPVLHDPPDRLL